MQARDCLFLCDIRFPSALDAISDGLIGWTLLGVRLEHALNRLHLSRRNLKAVTHPDLGNLQHALHILYVTFYVGYHIVDRFDLPHFQCSA